MFFPQPRKLGVFSHRQGLEQVGAAEISKAPRFPGTGSQGSRARFPSKVPEQGSQARFPSKVPKQGSQARFTSKVPKGSQEQVPRQGSQEQFLQVPKQGFQGAQARSQSKAPKQGPQSKVARNRCPLILKGSQEQVPRQSGKVPRNRFPRFPANKFRSKAPKKGSQARLPRRPLSRLCQGSVKALLL